LPDYAFSNWQATLVMMAFVVVTVLFNTFGTLLLPLVETVSLVGHLAGWIITTVVLWALCPKNTAQEVFTSVINSGGWSNTGLSCLVGSVAVLYAQLGMLSPTQALALFDLPPAANQPAARSGCGGPHCGGGQGSFVCAPQMYGLGLSL
jgi:hypothetical protein